MPGERPRRSWSIDPNPSANDGTFLASTATSQAANASIGRHHISTVSPRDASANTRTEQPSTALRRPSMASFIWATMGSPPTTAEAHDETSMSGCVMLPTTTGLVLIMKCDNGLCMYRRHTRSRQHHEPQSGGFTRSHTLPSVPGRLPGATALTSSLTPSFSGARGLISLGVHQQETYHQHQDAAVDRHTENYRHHEASGDLRQQTVPQHRASGGRHQPTFHKHSSMEADRLSERYRWPPSLSPSHALLHPRSSSALEEAYVSGSEHRFGSEIRLSDAHIALESTGASLASKNTECAEPEKLHSHKQAGLMLRTQMSDKHSIQLTESDASRRALGSENSRLERDLSAARRRVEELETSLDQVLGHWQSVFCAPSTSLSETAITLLQRPPDATQERPNTHHAPVPSVLPGQSQQT